jgi:hypothetical protein
MLLAGTAVFAAGLVLATPQLVRADVACSRSTYSYAGVASSTKRFGVAGSISAIRAPQVREGHVAAWVGLGGVGLGPGSTDEWLQAGISAMPGQAPSLYYEVTLPQQTPRYVVLKNNLPIDRPFAIVILESRAHPDTWQVWVDGEPVTDPIYLPGSHGAWRPVATAESWSGDTGGSCNGFAFRFQRIKVASKPGGDWEPIKGQVLSDAVYRIQHQKQTALVAVGG